MNTDDFIATLRPEDRPVFMQHVSGFAIPSRPDLGSYPDSYKHAAQALARSRGIRLVDAENVTRIRRYDVKHTPDEKTLGVHVIRPSVRLLEQIASMVAASEDYVVHADGIDDRVHMVVNDFDDGVWLCLHHDECVMSKFTRLQRLA